MRIIAVDFGGTRTRVALFAASASGIGMLRRAEMLSHVSDPPAEVINRIIQLAKTVTDDEPVEAIGVSAPGPLDPANGVILHARTLPHWQNIRIGELIARDFGDPPCFVENDANLAALAEFSRGAGKNCDPMVYLTLSTGIGGGLVIGGRLFHGWSGLACEPGHQVFPQADGKIRWLEELASGTALGQLARQRLANSTTQSVLRNLPPHAIDGKAVGEAAQSGDAFALSMIREAGQWLGMGLLNLIHLISPQRIVVGGSVSLLGDLLLEPARAVIQEHVLDARFLPDSLILPAALGDDVCLHGAAQYAYDCMIDGRR